MQQQNSGSLYLPLHHPQSPCSPAPLSKNLSFSDILLHDTHRVNSLQNRLTTSAASLPLFKGLALGTGNYVARISLGTPPKPSTVIIDTGSSLSWIQCRPCLISCYRELDPVFDPAASSTYRAIPCSAAQCSALLSATFNPSGCDTNLTCVYTATYGDGSFSKGFLSRDTLSLPGRGAAVPGFIFGCGQNSKGLFGESDGLFGLGKDSLSLFAQLSSIYGSSFSYCLASPFATGYLAFGPYSPANFVFTPLGGKGGYYSLQLASIAVAQQTVPVSGYTRSIIDSGTVFTRLPEGVYGALSAAVVGAIGGKVARAPAYSAFDTCFEGSAEKVPTPEVAFVFGGGAVVRLPASNVMVEVESGVTCLAFIPEDGAVTIGNWQQKTFDVVYDVGKGRIGFAAGGCG